MNCLISSSCDPSNENLEACDHKPCFCTGDGGFEILGEASVSVVFTDWLSITPADGLASRPSACCANRCSIAWLDTRT
jgi:hypothetical protein